MWMFLIVVSLLDQNQAASLPGKHGSVQLLLQQQYQTAITPSPVAPQQKTSSSSSSSSSSSDSSDSSQSAQAFQLMRDQPKLENTEGGQVDLSQEVGEQVDLSQESSEFFLPTSAPSSTNLQLSELVLLGQRAEERQDSQNKAMPHTFHLLLSPSRETPQTTKVGGDFTDGGVYVGGVGGAGGQQDAGDDHDTDEDELNGIPRVSDDSMEGGNGLALHLPGHRSDEAGLELAL
nr:uncharacterized protein LOC107376963 [Nothobranchius furzeri]